MLTISWIIFVWYRIIGVLIDRCLYVAGCATKNRFSQINYVFFTFSVNLTKCLEGKTRFQKPRRHQMCPKINEKPCCPKLGSCCPNLGRPLPNFGQALKAPWEEGYKLQLNQLQPILKPCVSSIWLRKSDYSKLKTKKVIGKCLEKSSEVRVFYGSDFKFTTTWNKALLRSSLRFARNKKTLLLKLYNRKTSRV